MTSEKGRGRIEPSTGDSVADGIARGGVVPGPLASLDTTLPPTPLKKLLAADGASIFVFSADSELVATVHESAGDQYPVFDLTEWGELLDLVEQGKCRIVLLDAELIRAGIEHKIAELHKRGTGIVTLIAASRDVAQSLIGLMSERAIHRLLIKPAAVGITRLLLESAVGRYLQLREAPVVADAAERIPGAAAVQQPPGSRLPIWAVAVAIVSLLIGAIAATTISQLDLFGGSAGPAASGAPGLAGARNEPVETIAVEAQTIVPATAVTDVTAADAANLTPAAGGQPAAAEPAAAGPADAAATGAGPGQPPADAVVAPADPADRPPAAEQPATADQSQAAEQQAAAVTAAPAPGVAATAPAPLDAALARAETALAAGDLPTMAAELDIARGLDPDSARLALLRNALAAALADPEPVAEPPPPAAADESLTPAAARAATAPAELSELDSLLLLAETRLESGQVVAPEGNSALGYFRLAEALDAAAPAVAAFRSTLASVVAVRARLVLEAGDTAAAQALLATATDLGADTDVLVQLDIDLTAALEREMAAREAGMAATAAARLSAGALLVPSGDSAVDWLVRLRGANPGHETLPALEDGIAQAIVARASAAIDGQDWIGAEPLVALLEQTFPAQTALIQPLRRDLDYGRRQSALIAELAAPGDLEVLVSAPADYPNTARQRDIEGWVDVEFVVGTDGLPTGIMVIGADPGGWFEEATLAAIAQYRFMPYVEDGQTYRRRARLRVRFGLE